jgi:hypothetical protein
MIKVLAQRRPSKGSPLSKMAPFVKTLSLKLLFLLFFEVFSQRGPRVRVAPHNRAPKGANFKREVRFA